MGHSFHRHAVRDPFPGDRPLGRFDPRYAGMFAGLIGKAGALRFVNVALAFSVPITLGLLCGMFNGSLVAWVRLPALIVTLGTMYAFRGFIVWYHVNPIYQLQPWFRVLGQEKIGPIPIPVIILLVVTFWRQSRPQPNSFRPLCLRGRRQRGCGQGLGNQRQAGQARRLLDQRLLLRSCRARLHLPARCGAVDLGNGFRAGRNSLCRGRWREPFRRPRDGREDARRRSNHAGRTKRSRHARRSVANSTDNLGFIIIVAVGVDLFVQTRRNNAKFSVAIREFFSGQ